jgi:long-chain acyl-CoA synthetase
MQFEPRYKTLVDIFDQSLSQHGARNLFGTKKDGRWVWITYAEFGGLVERFRGGLASIGVQRGDRVAIISNNRVSWAVAAHACYGIGAALVPMYEAQPPTDWEFIVRDCEAKVLIVASDSVLAKTTPFFDVTPALKRVVVLDGATNGDNRVSTYASLLASGATAPSIHPAPEDIAALLYTSGTTGNPKGVILSHGNIASNVSAAQQIFPIYATDRSLSILPWAHAFGQTADLHVLFACGAAIAICEGTDRILDNLAEVRPTTLACVPTIFNRVYTAVQAQLSHRPKAVQRIVQYALRLKAKERAGQRPRLPDRALLKIVDTIVFEKVRARLGGRLRFAISGGAALSRDVAEFIDSIGILVFEGYGLTETSPTSTVNTPDACKIGSVGRPLPGVRIEIDPATADHNPEEDDRSRKHPPRREGEIIVFGPNVMKGYLNRPEETAAVFTADGGFRTGDMGYLDAEGYLFITGRIKEQYKLENGKYVVPSSLEEQLKLSPYIANAMVYGDNKPYNVALVVANVSAVRKWATESHIALPENRDDLLKDDRVRALFAGEVAARSAEFKGFERIQQFALIAAEFTVESGMITPKMSLKRRRVVEAYGSLLEQLYSRGKSPPHPLPRY